MSEGIDGASPSPEPPGPSKPKRKDKARKHWYNFASRVGAQVVGAAASVALGLFLIQRSQQATPVATAPPAVPVEARRASSERAIVVLPLSNFSENPRQEYFADGMTEALTAALAEIDGLHVISRTSAMRYKAERRSIPVVAQELDVDFVVEGSVVRADDRVRITAQLIDARRDDHIWARTYDGTMADILDLQARVASAIAAEVKGALTPGLAPARRPVDPAVYDLYLRGRYAWALRTPEGFANAIKSFTEATERDPEFALGYAGLADAFSLFPTNSLVTRSANFARAREAAEKAVALDPTLAEAHTSLAAVYSFGERNFEAAAKEFERALALNSHYPTAHQWYAIALAENGRHAEALRHAEEAVAEDPLNGTMHQALGLVRYYARDFASATAALGRALELVPQLPLARVALARALLADGKPQEALRVLQQSPQPQSADVRLMMAIAQARLGHHKSAEEIVEVFEAESPPPVGILVQWHAAIGNHDAAFELMKRSPSPRDAAPEALRVDPLFERFRADRRYAALAR